MATAELPPVFHPAFAHLDVGFREAASQRWPAFMNDRNGPLVSVPPPVAIIIGLDAARYFEALQEVNRTAKIIGCPIEDNTASVR
jgi:hypothetical protein